MVDKGKFSKDVEEQIQSLASDIYIQVEDKLTQLISTAVKTETSKNIDQQSQYLSDKEQSLQKDFTEKQQLQLEEVTQLKQALAEKQVDEATNKQNFQVELTQNTINYSETIESLEKEIVNLKQQQTLQQDKKQSSNNKLDEKLLETEQKLNDRNQEIDGLNGRVMVLTEQEQSLTTQLTVAKEQIQLNAKQQNETVAAVKTQADASAKQQIETLTEQLQLNEKQYSEALTAIKEQTETSAKQQIDVLTEKLKLTEKQQSEAVIVIKTQAEATAKQQIDVLTEKLHKLESESARMQTEAQQSGDTKVKGLEQKISQLEKQADQEKNDKAELQQQLSIQKKSIDVEQDKNKQAEQKTHDFQAQIIKITEQAASDKQQLIDEIKSIKEGAEQSKQQHLDEIKAIHDDAEKVKQLHLDEIKAIHGDAEKIKQLHLDEIKAIHEEAEQVKQSHLGEINTINETAKEIKELQTVAQQKIIELEKANEQLNDKLATEQNDIKLYQQEVSVLTEQVRVAQEGQENILQRFNRNRDKQEIENNKVRETIKFLRDENHQLISDISEQKAQFDDQKSELEHKLTEYRLKFEYAQKQLTS
jgi:hypothetical protein